MEAPAIIADASNGKGGCWLEDDTILFAPGSSTPISRVDLKGGKPEAVTDLSKGTPANSHRHPRSMHDGRHFLFAARTTDSSSEEPVAIMLGDLEGGKPKTILRSTGQAEYLAGKILYRKNGNIFARAFDLATRQFTGSPILIAKDCGVIPGASLSLFSASASGTLVYHPGYAETSGTRMVWVDLQGKSLGQLDSAGGMGGFDISPDGRRVVFTKWDSRTGFGDLWLHQIESGVDSRLTFAATSEQSPVWSHDGKTIYYRVSSADSTAIFAIEPDGKEDPRSVYNRKDILQVVDVSPDGKYLSYTVRDSLDGKAILRVEITPVDLSTPPHRTRRELPEHGGRLFFARRQMDRVHCGLVQLLAALLEKLPSHQSQVADHDPTQLLLTLEPRWKAHLQPGLRQSALCD